MSGYALTPLAKADVFAVWSYIADDNEDAANRVEQAILSRRAIRPLPPPAGTAPRAWTRPTPVEIALPPVFRYHPGVL